MKRMKRKTPKTEEQKVKQYLIHKMRLAWRFYSETRKSCLKAAGCAVCKKKTTELVADHVNPVVDPKKGFEGWDSYVERMFHGKLQPLCGTCHREKSKEENRQRKQQKQLKNKNLDK